MLLIDSNIDAAYRRTLMNGVPVSLRSKMREALAAAPDAGSLEHSKRYFGDELQGITDRCQPLVQEIDEFNEARGLPGFRKWMIATGYTNEYRMIKVFDAWARMKGEADPKIKVPA